MDNQKIIGIIAIILGILVMIFPIASELVLSVFAGIAFVILGVYYIMAGAGLWNLNKWTSAAYVLIGILGLICGFMLFFNIALFNILIGFYMYIAGFMLLIAGILGLVSRIANIAKVASVLMLILGILTIIIGFLAIDNPLFVAILIGVSLIIDGVSLCVSEEVF
ncbi:DUF308 domain-containing protein [Methanobrevibacter sp. DSM 116169]|uniref:DUF308 domain-containing protein n=1 Tax=Methanobrevibacter sp. DSM 116169 TaxID=3242727 RepID=UPI0038FCA35D